MIFVCSRTTNIPYSIEGPYEIVLPTDFPGRDNISTKQAYRHLRQMYFIWKNLDLWDYPSEIGIFQERRRLQHIHIPKGYDIVLPTHMVLPSIYTQWKWQKSYPSHKLEYFEATLDLLPEMRKYSMLPQNTYARFHNIGIYPIEIYKEMCAFLFEILRVLEERINVDPTGDEATYAFLAERIADYWFYQMSSLKIFESPLEEYKKI